jgi:multidrug efflux pump
MIPSALFIRRPVATTLLTAAIAMAGAAAFTVLPVSPLPQIDFPTISISASLPGASAEIMASTVATPLERQFGQIAGLTEMTSTSSLGNTSVTLQFDLSRNVDAAAREVQAGINNARTYLPTNLPSNPTYRKVNPSDAPIIILGLTSDQYDRPALYDVASTILQQKLSQIEGVGQVSVGGGTLPSVRVDVDPTKLNSMGLTMQNVQSVLSLQNAHQPTGQISNELVTADIITNDQLFRAYEYRPLVIGFNRGAAVRLSDVADVTDSTQNIRTAGYLNNKPAIVVIVYREPGANIIQTVERVRAAIPSLKESIRRGIDITVVLDRTTTIRASVRDVEFTLMVSVLLVIAVVFLFLRNGRATLIPTVAVPVSLIGTFAVMYLFGYSIDNLSLMALTIATGFVVDDAIVVMEDIVRHVEAGMSPAAAALAGAREIGFTVFSISISLIAVFIPILLMAGIVGRLFREFAIVLSTAILVSMMVSLITAPTMCAYLLKDERGRPHGRLYRASERVFDGMVSIYRGSLAWALNHRFWLILILLATVALNVGLMVRIPKGFFPQQDTGAIMGGMQGPQNASFAVMDRSARELSKVVMADPAVENVVAFTGGAGPSNGGFIYVALKPLDARKVSASEVIARLRPKIMQLPVASAFLQAVQDLRIGGRSSNALYQYTIQSTSVKELSQWGPLILAQMKTLHELRDANSDQQNNGLDQFLTYDRVTAARLGITPQSLNSSLYGAFGQSQVSVIYTPLNQYYVVLEVAEQFRQNPRGLKFIYLNTPPNGAVPLNAVTQSQATTTPLSLNHTGLFPSVTVSFNLAEGVSLSDASQAIQDMQAQLGMPSTIRGFFAGTLQAFQQSLGSEPYLVLTALLAVYIVLGILYESLIHPLTIISTLPSASAGAMLALILLNTDLSVISIIGIVLLIGIVKKNAIMMIDFALVAERERGMSPAAAITEACMLRFRPILMTTMCAMFGALPLALGTGTGSELRRPLGITIVGGLIVSQLLTLYTTPVVYVVLDNLRRRVQGHGPHPDHPPETPHDEA